MSKTSATTRRHVFAAAGLVVFAATGAALTARGAEDAAAAKKEPPPDFTRMNIAALGKWIGGRLDKLGVDKEQLKEPSPAPENRRRPAPALKNEPPNERSKQPVAAPKKKDVPRKPAPAYRRLPGEYEMLLRACRLQVQQELRLLLKESKTAGNYWNKLKWRLLTDDYRGSAAMLRQAYSSRLRVEYFKEFWEKYDAEALALYWKSLMLAGYEGGHTETEAVYRQWLQKRPPADDERALAAYEADKKFHDEFKQVMRNLGELEREGNASPDALWKMLGVYESKRPPSGLKRLTVLLKLQAWYPDDKRVKRGDVAWQTARLLHDEFKYYKEAAKWAELMLRRYPDHYEVKKSGSAYWLAHDSYFLLAEDSRRGDLRPPLGLRGWPAIKPCFQRALELALTVRRKFPRHWANKPRWHAAPMAVERIGKCESYLNLKDR